MMRNYQVRFGGGRMENGQATHAWNLASRLPYLEHTVPQPDDSPPARDTEAKILDRVTWTWPGNFNVFRMFPSSASRRQLLLRAARVWRGSRRNRVILGGVYCDSSPTNLAPDPGA
jgi:hypothetical protein